MSREQLPPINLIGEEENQGRVIPDPIYVQRRPFEYLEDLGNDFERDRIILEHLWDLYLLDFELDEAEDPQQRDKVIRSIEDLSDKVEALDTSDINPRVLTIGSDDREAVRDDVADEIMRRLLLQKIRSLEFKIEDGAKYMRNALLNARDKIAPEEDFIFVFESLFENNQKNLYYDVEDAVIEEFIYYLVRCGAEDRDKVLEHFRSEMIESDKIIELKEKMPDPFAKVDTSGEFRKSMGDVFMDFLESLEGHSVLKQDIKHAIDVVLKKHALDNAADLLDRKLIEGSQFYKRLNPEWSQ